MIRKYSSQDKKAVLHLLELNTPKYFSVEEQKDLVHYLATDSEHYFVFEEKEQIIGSGGFNLGFDEGAKARISWDLVHPNHQKKGVGSQLVNHRLQQLKKLKQVKTIEVRTAQLTYEYYQKFGFELKETVKDYWAMGFDLYTLHLPNKKT